MTAAVAVVRPTAGEPAGDVRLEEILLALDPGFLALLDWDWGRRVITFPRVHREESRQRVAAAKDRALREMQGHLHGGVELDWLGRSSDCPGAREVLRRITAADGPEAQ